MCTFDIVSVSVFSNSQSSLYSPKPSTPQTSAFAHRGVAVRSSDDSEIVGLITNGNEDSHRATMGNCHIVGDKPSTVQCEKSKELVVDLSRTKEGSHLCSLRQVSFFNTCLTMLRVFFSLW